MAQIWARAHGLEARPVPALIGSYQITKNDFKMKRLIGSCQSKLKSNVVLRWYATICSCVVKAPYFKYLVVGLFPMMTLKEFMNTGCPIESHFFMANISSQV